MLHACLQYWPKEDFVKPALAALATPSTVCAFAGGDDWEALLPVGEALLGLWPHPAKELLQINTTFVSDMQHGKRPPHERVLLFFLVFAMLTNGSSSIPPTTDDSEDASDSEAKLVILFQDIAAVVCPFQCPAVGDMCNYALERVLEGCKSAASALRILHTHFLKPGQYQCAAPAQIVPLWNCDSINWDALPVNRAVGLSCSPHRVRMFVRFASPLLVNVPTNVPPVSGAVSNAVVSLRSSAMSLTHDSGVHDFSLNLSNATKGAHGRAVTRLDLHRVCHAKTRDSPARFHVKFAVLRHESRKELIPQVFTKHLGSIEGSHYVDAGMFLANDSVGCEGFWTSLGSPFAGSRAEDNLEWRVMCRDFCDPVTGSIVCCVDIEDCSQTGLPLVVRP